MPLLKVMLWANVVMAVVNALLGNWVVAVMNAFATYIAIICMPTVDKK